MGKKVLMASLLSLVTLVGTLHPSWPLCWAQPGKLSCLSWDLGGRASGEQTCGF